MLSMFYPTILKQSHEQALESVYTFKMLLHFYGAISDGKEVEILNCLESMTQTLDRLEKYV